MSVPPRIFPGARLHIVSGKGGTGKTTVAAALALALAAGGRRTLLVEVEGRQGIAALFDSGPLPYEERRVARAPGGGEVLALAIDPEAALLEYLELFYNLRRAGSALARMGAIDFATTIAPGVRDVLLTGKAIEAVRRTEQGRHIFDAVVMDAPPTGRIARFLNVNSEVAGIARVGPIHTQANSVMTVMRSPRTKVHLVTLLEEMPVQETLDAVAELTAQGLPDGAIIVNNLQAPVLTPSQQAACLGLAERSDAGLPAGLHRQDLLAAIGRAEVVTAKHAASDAQILAALLDQARDHALHVEMTQAERARLGGAGRPIVDLPRIPSGIDFGALLDLSSALREAGLGTQAPR